MRSGGGNRDRGRNAGTAGRTRDRDGWWRRIGWRSIVHGHGDGGGGGLVSSRISSDGGQRVRTVRGRGRIPGRGIGRCRVLSSQVGAVELELNAGDSHVIGSGGGNRDRGGHGGTASRTRDRDCGWRRIGWGGIVHGHRDGGGGGLVSSRISSDGCKGV